MTISERSISHISEGGQWKITAISAMRPETDSSVKPASASP